MRPDRGAGLGSRGERGVVPPLLLIGWRERWRRRGHGMGDRGCGVERPQLGLKEAQSWRLLTVTASTTRAGSNKELLAIGTTKH